MAAAHVGKHQVHMHAAAAAGRRQQQEEACDMATSTARLLPLMPATTIEAPLNDCVGGMLCTTTSSANVHDLYHGS